MISGRPGVADRAVFVQGAESYGCHDVVARTQMLDENAGSMLGLIDRYQYGSSLSEATNPDSPVGAAVAAPCRLRGAGDQTEVP